jgi:hypothetical protein
VLAGDVAAAHLDGRRRPGRAAAPVAQGRGAAHAQPRRRRRRRERVALVQQRARERLGRVLGRRRRRRRLGRRPVQVRVRGQGGEPDGVVLLEVGAGARQLQEVDGVGLHRGRGGEGGGAVGRDGVRVRASLGLLD